MLSLRLVRFARGFIFDTRRFIAFGAFLLFLLFLFDLVDSVLEIEITWLTFIIVCRNFEVVIDLIAFTFLVFLIFTDFVNYGISFLAIDDRIFRYYVRLLPIVIVPSKFKVFLNVLSDCTGLMGQIRDIIFNNVSLLAVEFDLAYLVVDTIGLLTLVTVLIFERFCYLSRISLWLR